MAFRDTPDDPEAAGCLEVNDYCERRHRGVVSCSWLPEKGRILLAEETFEPGEIIFREPPLHLVAERPGDEAFDQLKELSALYPQVFRYKPLWYWTALSSLTFSEVGDGESGLLAITEEEQTKLLLLFHPEVSTASEACVVLVREFHLAPHLEAVKLERLLQIWMKNCFEHSESPLGYSVYFLSSFMSHSCLPNASWHYDGGNFVLRARAAVAPDDEIVVSYLAEDELLESTPARQRHLEAKDFLCNCERCGGSQDLSRVFRCKQCTEGAVFLAAQGPECDQKVGGACSGCSHELCSAEVSALLMEEQEVERLLASHQEKMGTMGHGRHRAMLGSLEEVARRAEATMVQHWLLDRAWLQLSQAYGHHGRLEESEALLQRRLVFQRATYPGISGTRAWTLEAYGDLLLQHRGCAVDPEVKVPGEQEARAVAPLAPQVYREALEVLRAMFGEKHEYAVAVHRKVLELTAELRKHLG